MITPVARRPFGMEPAYQVAVRNLSYLIWLLRSYDGSDVRSTALPPTDRYAEMIPFRMMGLATVPFQTHYP